MQTIKEYVKALIFEQEENETQILKINALLQSIQHKFSDSLTFVRPAILPLPAALALAAVATAPQRLRFYYRYDNDPEFKVLVDKSVLWSKDNFYNDIRLFNPALLREFWKRSIRNVVTADDILIWHNKWCKLSAEAFKACAEIAANAEQFFWLIKDNADEIEF